MVYSSKRIVAHFVAYECTLLSMYNNQMKSKQIQRNVGKIGVPELNLHPVDQITEISMKKYWQFSCQDWDKQSFF